MAGSSARAGIAWASAAAVLSALYVLPWKLAAQHGSSAAATLVMLASAALCSSAALPWARRVPGSAPGPALSRAELALGAQLALFTLAGNWASAIAIAELSPALHAVLLRSEVLWVALLALGLLGERVERRFWVGAALAAVGLVVVCEPGTAHVRSLAGPLGALVAAASFGTMTVMTRRAIRAVDPVRVNALRLWFAVALWFAVNGAPPAAGELPAPLIAYAALAALSGPFASRLCLMYSTRYIDARITAMLGLSTPALALGLSWLAFRDWPTARELAGGALLLLGIAVPMTVWARPARASAAQRPAA